MSEHPPLLIRADAGGYLGTGHVMRMIALAQAWLERGGEVRVAACRCPEWLRRRIEEEGIGFLNFGEGVEAGSAEDGELTAALLESMPGARLAVDGYQFDAAYLRRFGEAGSEVMVMDDYRHCTDWPVRWVVNQNVYADELDYPESAAEFLLGPRYALLRSEFLTDFRPPSPGPVGKLLLSFGGVDPDGVTVKVLEALNTLRGGTVEVRVLAGKANPHFDEVERLGLRSPHPVEILSDVADMPALYRWADGIVGAGGTTCLEWLRYGLPAALVCLADNQRLVVDKLARTGAALDLGWHRELDRDTLAADLAGWLDGGGGGSGEPKVDPFGARRVASRIAGDGIWFREAREDDCRLYFEWANDRTVREQARNPEAIPWDDHCHWFSGRIASKDCLLFLFLDEKDEPAGQVRFDFRGREGWEIDCSVAPGLRGRGIGSRVMELAIAGHRRQRGGSVFAIVRRGNGPSAGVFEKLGFRRTTCGCDHYLRFEK